VGLLNISKAYRIGNSQEQYQKAYILKELKKDEKCSI
jgi:soluble P-type ATPase